MWTPREEISVKEDLPEIEDADVSRELEPLQTMVLLRQVGVQGLKEEVWPCRLKGLCHQMMKMIFGILKVLDKIDVLIFGILKVLDKIDMLYTLKVW